MLTELGELCTPLSSSGRGVRDMYTFEFLSLQVSCAVLSLAL